MVFNVHTSRIIITSATTFRNTSSNFYDEQKINSNTTSLVILINNQTLQYHNNWVLLNNFLHFNISSHISMYFLLTCGVSGVWSPTGGVSSLISHLPLTISPSPLSRDDVTPASGARPPVWAGPGSNVCRDHNLQAVTHKSELSE